jgi:hypothetical protein
MADMPYRIEACPVISEVREYINGDAERQLVFELISNEPRVPDPEWYRLNYRLLCGLGEWLERRGHDDDLPSLDSGKKAIRYEVLTMGGVFGPEPDEARYRAGRSTRFRRRSCEMQ